MSETQGYKERPEYKELPRSRQMLVDALIETMHTAPEWHRSWKSSDVPMSMTGREYRGENNVSLTLASLVRGYDDPRWMTFNQMRQSGWSFKTDDSGRSMGKDAGVAVSFFVLRDKKTKAEFDKSTVAGLSREDQEKYMRDNVYPIRRTYVVFNASIIKGVPEYAKKKGDASGRSEEADRFIDFWDKNMTPIRYGGDRSCFVTKKNLIRLPHPEAFESMPEFYATALHEISHSCQGFTRPGEDLDTNMGSPQYRRDELSAEISGVFLSQKLCGTIDRNALKNSAAYLDSWLLGETDELKMFFDAATEADKLTRFAVSTYEKRLDDEAEVRAREMRDIKDSAVQSSLFDNPSGEGEKARMYPRQPSRFDIAEELARPEDEVRAREENTDPLGFRLGKGKEIPADAYEARMVLLGDTDRKKVEDAFKNGDPEFKTLYFGGNPHGSDAKNAAALMTYCAFLGGDAMSTKRIFTASALSDAVDEKFLDPLAKSAVNFADTFHDSMMRLTGWTPEAKNPAPEKKSYDDYGK